MSNAPFAVSGGTINTKNVQDIFRYNIGIDGFLNPDSNIGNFPPHNIEKIDESRYILTLAVAGFTKHEIDIKLHLGNLMINGKKDILNERDLNEMKVLAGVQAEIPPVEKTTFLYQGIAFRDFTREFRLGEDVEVKSASLQDGLLKIELNRLIPPAEIPKTIPIK